MKNILLLGMALGVVCTVAAVVLGFAEIKTREQRYEARREGELEAIKSILPEFDNNPLQDKSKVLVDDVEVIIMQAKKEGAIIAYAVQSAAQGYGGKVETVAGIKPDGEILHVIVLPGHEETPGLGSVATDRRQRKTIYDILGKSAREETENGLPPSPYLDQFNQYNLLHKTEYRISQDTGEIDAVSGATITSRAVAKAVTRAAIAFKEYKSGQGISE